MATETLKEATARRETEIESNRALGVHAGPQTDVTYEVIDGHHRLPDGTRLGPGHRFHPTHAQARNNTLRGKVRELSAREVRELDQPRTRTAVAGADIGLRSVSALYGRVLKYAIENGLEPDDFDGIEPAGNGGGYTMAQVDEIVASKAN